MCNKQHVQVSNQPRKKEKTIVFFLEEKQLHIPNVLSLSLLHPLILLFYYYIPGSDIKMQSHEVPIKSLLLIFETC